VVFRDRSVEVLVLSNHARSRYKSSFGLRSRIFDKLPDSPLYIPSMSVKPRGKSIQELEPVLLMIIMNEPRFSIVPMFESFQSFV
jgi:hypothetical protein